jgi:hypothetical protein
MNSKPDPWDDYRSRRRWFIWTFVTFLPGVGIIGKSLEWLFNTGAAIGVVAVVWALAYGISAWRFSTLRCPRCKREFYSSFLVNWNFGDESPFAKRCSRCGLEKWKDPESPQTEPV